MSSSDGFCSALSFAHGELGTTYRGSLDTRTHHPSAVNTSGSAQTAQLSTPTGSTIPSLVRYPSSAGTPLAPPQVAPVRPMSPTRTNSASSVGTQSSFAQTPAGVVISNPTPSLGNVPSVAAAHSGAVTGVGPMPSPTPPMTPLPHNGSTQSAGGSFAGPTGGGGRGKREDEADREKGEGQEMKKRRIAPTLVTAGQDDDRQREPK